MPPPYFVSVKGAALSAAEYDANISGFGTRLRVLEQTPTPALTITNVTKVGSQAIFHRSDGQQYPADLPRAPARTVPRIIATTTHVLSLADYRRYHRCTHINGCTITIQPFEEEPVHVNFEAFYRQGGNQPVILEFHSDVIVNDIEGFSLQTGRRGAVIGVKNVGLDEWDVIGAPAAL